MGAISQLEDGRFFLEDLTASVPIDVADAISSSLECLEPCSTAVRQIMLVFSF